MNIRAEHLEACEHFLVGLYSEGLIFGGLIFRRAYIWGAYIQEGLYSGGLYSGGLIFGGLIFRRTYIQGAYIQEGLYLGGLYSGGLIFGGLIFRGSFGLADDMCMPKNSPCGVQSDRLLPAFSM